MATLTQRAPVFDEGVVAMLIAAKLRGGLRGGGQPS